MQTSFDHILVPVDFSEKNESALQIAMQMATQNSARVSLLHVIESIDYGDDGEVQAFFEKMKTRSGEQLEDLRQRFTGCEVDIETETTVANRSRGIVTYAMETGVDLIVMSSHQIDPSVKRDDWATISYQVSLVCPCSIMLVKPPAD